MLGDVRAVFLPYCLDRQPDGRYAILNREYKPVGFFTKEWINYADYPVLVNLKGLGPQTIERLSDKGDPDPDRIYLYNDGSVPTRSAENMENYLKPLAILAKLETSQTDIQSEKQPQLGTGLTTGPQARRAMRAAAKH